MENLTALVKFLLLLFSVHYVSAQTCSTCGTIIEGDPFTEGLVKGLFNITTNSGPQCSHQITCSRVDALSPDGYAIVSAMTEESELVELGVDVNTVSIVLECDSSGNYILQDYPEYPLAHTIYCESTTTTPIAPIIQSPITTTTVSSVNTCSICGDIIEGDSDTEGMIRGLLNITTNAGPTCSHQITCSRANTAPNGLVTLSVMVDENDEVEVGSDPTMVSVTLECSSSGKYVIPDYPEYSLSNVVYCETTPANPVATTIATLTTTASTNICPACGNLFKGNSYTAGLVKGILNIITNPGFPCTQQITCSRLNASPEGFVSLSTTVEGHGLVELEIEINAVSITLECDSNGKYIVPGFPQFPLSNNTIYCESTPDVSLSSILLGKLRLPQLSHNQG